jgi:hypothetical protein
VWFCNHYYNSVTAANLFIDPKMVSAPKGGGVSSSETLKVDPRGIATDGKWLYWALTSGDRIGGTVRRRRL